MRNKQFYDRTLMDTYFEKGRRLLDKSAEALELAHRDDLNGGAYGLVTVIYSVVLFLLGIANFFPHMAYKYAVTAIALSAFIAATIYMATLPLPSGFSLREYLSI